MIAHFRIGLLVAGGLVCLLLESPAPACCPVPPEGEAVVNADQTVILIWDPTSKTEHFIRKASFKSGADDFGFLVPSPSQPELEEAGNDVFPILLTVTQPERKKVARPNLGMSCGCASEAPPQSAEEVMVLAEKEVAGFNAVVLQTGSSRDLVAWLKKYGYPFSPQVEAWARPYVAEGWKITALKVAKGKEDSRRRDVNAAALRMTFKTERPLFPYREPDFKGAPQALGANRRLLRIYFLSDARYRGDLTEEQPWTGRVAWADRLKVNERNTILELLRLPAFTAPVNWWLTEFEDNWPYQVAPADLYFSRDPSQDAVKRKPIIEYTFSPWPGDIMPFVIAGVLAVPWLLRRLRPR